MHSAWLRSSILRLLKFLQIKEGRPNFWRGGLILQKVWIIWSPLLYSNLKRFKDPKPLSFIRFQCILLDSRVSFSEYSNEKELKRGDLISWGEPILQKIWIIWSPLLYLNVKIFKDPNSMPFIRFQCILYDSEELLLDFWNFHKLKRGRLISGGNQFWRKSELFGLPYCISILKVLTAQILRHSLDFHAFCFIQEYLSQKFEISTH